MKLHKFLLILIILMSGFLRFTQLGYSNFYGDETKAIYYKKENAAFEHFFNQRKGPGQFLIAWTIEKMTGGYKELYMRLPSAILGTASVYILFLLINNMFDQKTALVSALFYGLNGFYIAFSRILQYQSFYIFLGLLSFYLLTEFHKKNNSTMLFLSGIMMGTAFLFHYDSLFFLLPSVFYIYLKDKTIKDTLSKYLKYYVIPIAITISIYYIPYVIFGSFRADTLPYLIKRMSGGGQDTRPSNNLYTINFYNPLLLSLLLMPFSIFSLFKIKINNVKVIYIWFLLPFIIFQLIFRSSGTHIHNFVLPWIILSCIGIVTLSKKFRVIKYLTIILALITLVIQSIVFIPFLNKGYPWKDTSIMGFPLPKLRQDLQVFAYGFPYYRNWDEIAEYLNHYDRGFPFYTNDNYTISDFYLRKFKYYDGRQTMFYIDINHNQLDNDIIEDRYLDERAYYPAKDFHHKGETTATVYLRYERNRF